MFDHLLILSGCYLNQIILYLTLQTVTWEGTVVLTAQESSRSFGKGKEKSPKVNLPSS